MNRVIDRDIFNTTENIRTQRQTFNPQWNLLCTWRKQTVLSHEVHSTLHCALSICAGCICVKKYLLCGSIHWMIHIRIQVSERNYLQLEN